MSWLLATQIVSRILEYVLGRHLSNRYKFLKAVSGIAGEIRGKPRAILYMAALAAMRCNRIIQAFYQSLATEGKRHKVATTACMRKLLVILNAMARDQIPWQIKHV